MKLSQEESVEFWRSHILKAKSQSISTVKYCKANNLLESSFYYWRDKIFSNKNSKIKKLEKKENSPFLPVVVAATELKMQTYPLPELRQLPDSRWVAEIITNVIRGLL